LPCQGNVKNPTGQKKSPKEILQDKKNRLRQKSPYGKLVKTSPSSIFDVYFFGAASITTYYDIDFSNNFVPRA
jgi:hypothetical protein